MHIVTQIFVGLVAIEHIYILWLEMFAWTTRGPKTFPLPAHLFEPTKVLAANQGLYNGFLAAGLLWSLLITDPIWQKNVALFFWLASSSLRSTGGIQPANASYWCRVYPL